MHFYGFEFKLGKYLMLFYLKKKCIIRHTSKEVEIVSGSNIHEKLNKLH